MTEHNGRDCCNPCRLRAEQHDRETAQLNAGVEPEVVDLEAALGQTRPTDPIDVDAILPAAEDIDRVIDGFAEHMKSKLRALRDTEHARMTDPHRVPRLIVLRIAAGVPEDLVPAEADGKFLDLDELGIPADVDIDDIAGFGAAYFDGRLAPDGGAVAEPTDRFERRESDGATARVFEFRA